MHWNGRKVVLIGSNQEMIAYLFVLMLIFSLFYCQQVGGSSNAENGSKKKLLLLAMAPFRDPDNRIVGWTGGPALIPAARLARDHINNRTDILSNYTLELIVGDSACSLTDKTLVNFAESMLTHDDAGNIETRGVVGIVGPACFASTRVTAPLLTHPKLNLMQVSITTTSRIKSLFPPNFTHFSRNTFRMAPSSLAYVDAFYSIIYDAGWSRVGVLYDYPRQYHTDIFNEFRRRIGSTLESSYGVTTRSLKSDFAHLKERLIRIVFVFAGQEMAQRILCEAYKQNQIYPSVQLLFADRQRSELTDESFLLTNGINCTKEEMESALNGAIIATFNLSREDRNSNETVSGFSYNEYRREYFTYYRPYLKEIGTTRHDVPNTGPNFAVPYYDAVWALALALNNLAADYDLTEYSKDPENIGNAMRRYLEEELLFEGMSGTINSEKDKTDALISLEQTMSTTSGGNSDTTKVLSTELLNEDNTLEYLPDSFPINVYSIPEPLGILIFISAAIGCVVLMSLQLVFQKYSGNKEVKAISPNLNHLIFSACYLWIIGLVIYTSQETYPVFFARHQVLYGVSCSVVYWCIALALTLVFGTVSAKTWRIYRIFSHFKQGKVKYVSDKFLVGYVAFLILIDLGILTAWNLINPWYLSTSFSDRDMAMEEHHTCLCDNFVSWLTALLMYKLIQIILVVSLSILIRRIKRKGFKNTKAVIGLSYILIIIYVLGFAFNIIFRNIQPLVSFIGLASMCILSVFLICVSLFLVNVWPLIFVKKKKKKPLTTPTPSTSTTTTNGKIRAHQKTITPLP